MKAVSGFTLIELIVVTTIIGILSSLSVSFYGEKKEETVDAWANAIVSNSAKILMASEFISSDGVNFADLDADNNYGLSDLVSLTDVLSVLDTQDYILPQNNRGVCFLYGYEASSSNKDDMIVIADKQASSGIGDVGFIFLGTDDALNSANNITAIDCTPGSVGVTGGTWADYQWLNFIP